MHDKLYIRMNIYVFACICDIGDEQRMRKRKRREANAYPCFNLLLSLNQGYLERSK